MNSVLILERLPCFYAGCPLLEQLLPEFGHLLIAIPLVTLRLFKATYCHIHYVCRFLNSDISLGELRDQLFILLAEVE